MAHPAYEQRDFNTAAELWAELSPTKKLFPDPSKMIFRGQANADWALVPTVLRDEQREHVVETFYGDQHVGNQIFYEALLLETFGQFCDQVGVRIPGDSIMFRETKLTTQRDDYLRSGAWPPPDLLEVMALAQHHAVPTRLLDWSKNPFAAVYFASASAFERLSKGTRDDRMAIWVLNIERINLYAGYVKLVKPPGSTTPNLAAQAALFTVQQEKGTRGHPFRVSPLEEVFSIIPDTPLLKLTVPVAESVTLFNWCGRVGVTAASMYPGPDGAARAVVDSMRSWRAGRVFRHE